MQLLILYSHGQFYHFLSLLDALEVVEEEVHVESSLENATQYLSPAEEVVHVVSVHPKIQLVTTLESLDNRSFQNMTGYFRAY